MSFITAVTHHLSSSHPPSFIPPPSHPITLPSYCPFWALPPPSPLSLLLNLPSLVSLSPYVLSPWPHLSSSSGSLIFFILVSRNPPFLSVISTSSLPFLFPSVRCSGLFTYGSVFISETQGIPRTYRHNRHPRQAQPIDTDADVLHAAVEQQRPEGSG